MKLSDAKGQTLFLTGVNGIVRAMGLLMRVMLSRKLGAEIMGIIELAQSVHMIAIAPFTSGLPAAISRLTAKAAPVSRTRILGAGLQLVRFGSFFLIPVLWFFSTTIAKISGDVRVLPSLWFTAPCIMVLGYSAVYNGYCYGVNRSILPACSELIEQCMRFLLTFVLLDVFGHLTAAWAAAVPAAATLAAEFIGLFYVLHSLRVPHESSQQCRKFRRPVFRLALPATLTRLVQTFVRSATAILIPVQLHRSGLPAEEATALLGMYNGMVMPVLMLPGVFTSALSMVMLPRIAKAEEQPHELKRLLLISMTGCMAFSLICFCAVFYSAPFLSTRLYRQPELTELFRFCAPMTLLMSGNHLLGSVLSALGQQRRTFYASSTVSAVTLALTWKWTSMPQMRILGVINAQYAGMLLTCVLSIFLLCKRRREIRSGDRSV